MKPELAAFIHNALKSCWTPFILMAVCVLIVLRPMLNNGGRFRGFWMNYLQYSPWILAIMALSIVVWLIVTRQFGWRLLAWPVASMQYFALCIIGMLFMASWRS